MNKNCLTSQLYQITSKKNWLKTCLAVDYDAHNVKSDATSLKQLAIQWEDTNVFSLACYIDGSSSIEPFIYKRVISSLLYRELYTSKHV